MKEKLKKNKGIVIGMLVIAFVFVVGIIYLIQSTYAVTYVCPGDYQEVVPGDDTCYGTPISSPNGCTSGSYDEDEGYCFVSMSCPSGYTYRSDTQGTGCYGNPTTTPGYSCAYGSYDGDEGWCFYTLSCPSGYTRNGGTSTHIICEIPNSDPYQSTTVSCPSGYTLSGSTCSGNPIAATQYSCSYGSYDADEGNCFASMACPSGYTYRSDAQGTGCYGNPLINYTCAYGSYDADEGNCYASKVPSSSGDGGGGGIVVTTYTVTFNANGGSWNGTDTQTASATSSNSYTVSKPSANPTNEELEFGGWKLGQTGTCNNTATTFTVSSNTTYYACWDSSEPLEYYTVTYNLDGGKFADETTTRTIIINNIDTLVKPATNPIKENSKFKGWYNGATEFTGFGSAINANLTLTAKWDTYNDQCTYTCETDDIYDPASEKCISLETINNTKIFSSSVSLDLACTDSVFSASNAVCTTDSCDINCSTGYTKEYWLTSDDCYDGASCTTSENTCSKTFKANCYKTYDATENCGSIEEGPKTADFPIVLIIILGLGGLGYALYYINKKYSVC